MPDLAFEVTGARAVPHAATPLLALDLRITSAPAEALIQSILLRCQVRIAPQRRSYSGAEREALRELFGDESQWDRALTPMLWAHAMVVVPAFRGETKACIELGCTLDLFVASARYLHALDGGAAPLHLLFSGTVFHTGPDGALAVEQVPWSKEARHALPVAVLRETMEIHYPGTAPLAVRRDLFERLLRYRAQEGLISWDRALESLLTLAEGS